jgi:hypothetical protein
MLAGVRLLSTARIFPGAYLLARNILEWSAMACHLVENLTKLIGVKDWQSAFILVRRADTANSWVKHHGGKYDSSLRLLDDVKDPIRIKDLRDSYKRHEVAQRSIEDVNESYSYLSEYSHPNGARLVHYREIEGARVVFVAPSPDLAALCSISQLAIEWLLFAQELLGLADEAIVRDQLIAAAGKLADTVRTE